MKQRGFTKALSCLLAFGMVSASIPGTAFAKSADGGGQERNLAESRPAAQNGGRYLTTDVMTVEVGQSFPYIVQYQIGDSIFYGQTEEIHTMKINGESIQVGAEDVETTFTENKAVYVMSLKGTNVDCVITAKISAEKNTASFDITKVVNNLDEKDANGYEVHPVQTIEIPNHSLISVRSSQSGAHLKGAKMSSNTLVSGDSDFDVTKGMKLTGGASSEDFMYGFISNHEFSAGLWSNSEYEGTHKASYISAGGASNTRVMATVSSVGSDTSLGLASTAWYYDRKITPNVFTDATNNISESRTYVVEHEIMPSAKVVITGDENDDGDIDWQDGAVAFRDIMHNPQGCEEVPELVNYRIAMNFGSQAANPFLANLDGVKRVYLNTDGLGQGVLLKGYGSEGHDSGHPDYGNIGARIGGAEDMNTLLIKGKEMGALFGVHVNASEMYTESKAFSDELSGGYGGLELGWNWLDQGIGINSAYDLATRQREDRFKELYAQVGNNLDFIYVDVWGNAVSTAASSWSEDAWHSRMLAREINRLGWRLATEWGPTQEYDSTLQHWAADLEYGGYSSKGENSEVMRFLRNHQKDSWIADYPSYGGAAQMPLLGGLNMTDFEGWQGRTNYDNYIKVMFRHNLITKYLQHYQVVDWVNGTTVSVPPTQESPGSNPGGSWTPEMQITLRNTEDEADSSEIVVSRDSNDYSDLSAYRSRTITVDGVTVSKGAPTGGDGTNPGNETYLIPWNWDAHGEDLAEDDRKLYHWNTTGGETEWTLTKDWEGLSSVVVYKLTDEGKTEQTVVNVTDNKIKLTAEAETPYVIYKGEKANLTVDWQTSKYIYDTGFNDTDVNSHRTVSGPGTAEIVENISANHMLKLEGEVSVDMNLTNLKAGQKYALYAGVDNRSQSNAYMTVTSNGKTLGTNYTGRSFVENIVSSDQHHTGAGGTTDDGNLSYFQNMYVFFTADADTAVLTLKRDAGEGASYFDDVRIVETEMDAVRAQDANGNITELYNDFEHNAQGIWPFVISGPKDESGTYEAFYYVTDNRIHLSERHGKYTQAGFMVKGVDDVLDGDWSVKINGLTQRMSMIYQTIPQNFHFLPGEVYQVSFDYQMGGDQTYEVRLGDGTDINVKSWALEETPGETKTFQCTFTASESGDSWIGIYSTANAADDHGLTGKQFDFGGYKDFILDNIRIKKSKMMLETPKSTTVTTAKDKLSLNVKFTDEKDKGTPVAWKSSDESVARVTKNGDVYFVGFGTATITASAVIDGKEETLSCTVSLLTEKKATGTFRGAWASSQNSDSEGPENVMDKDAFSNWISGQMTESEPETLTVLIDEKISDFDTVAFRQRSDDLPGIVYQYRYIVGTAFDSASNTITEPSYTSEVQTLTNDTGYAVGAVVELEIPERTDGGYLQIQVTGAYQSVAAISDILFDKTVSTDTPEERAFMEANKKLVDSINQDTQKPGGDQGNKPEDKPTQQPVNQKGDTYDEKGMRYQITDTAKKTAMLIKGKNAASVKIPASVKINNETFKVTAIGSKAFNGYKRLKTVTLGSHVAEIKANAFFNCKKLTKVNAGKKLSKVNKTAFKKSPVKKISVKLPKSLKKNKKLKNQLVKAGIRKNKIK